MRKALLASWFVVALLGIAARAAGAAETPALQFQDYARTASGNVRLVYLLTSTDRSPITSLILELHELLALDQVEPGAGWSAAPVHARKVRLTPILPLLPGASASVAITLHVIDPALSNPFLTRHPPSPFEVTAHLAGGGKTETRAEPLYLGN